MIYSPKLDQNHELHVAIGLEDCEEHLGIMPSLCIHTSYETSWPLSSALSDVGHVCISCDWAQCFDKLKRAPTFILVMCSLWKMLLATNDFHCEDFSLSFDTSLHVMLCMGIGSSSFKT